MAETNQPKPWYRSRTIWGIAIFAISTFAPKYAPIAEAIPALADEIGQVVGTLWALYGRAKAVGPITTP